MTKDSSENTLLARREALLNVMQSSTSDSQPVELDQSRVGRLSRMDALQGQAMAQETERRRKNELQRIESALARIKEGEYGVSVSCGDEISKKRLELDPSAPLCIDCASRG
ncbi:TraR/DksA family transcriptional regulator [uncultured Sneathiella sp.]|uniref:TraR/DksA family transcriptional regulator n=1 Tax=uncultured Sneathiella sp. TaxID=879315 RepID=UPI0030EB8FD0|tara:strand:- start:15224 stop:15556 length:333 start_codon:yes stop_codon:yes gene_type:complete